MGQFKPMVKMETTEPSVILKLKNGGHVAMKKGGSATEAKKMAFGGLPSSMPAKMNTKMPPMVDKDTMMASAPKKPSMASRRKSMMSMKAPVTPVMKDGGDADMAQDKAMIKKAMKQHDMQEHKGGKGTKLKLKKGGDCYATGGVVMGQGGYKNGGSVIPVSASEKGAKAYVNTKMNTTPKGTKTGKTGEVKKGNGGGYAKGGGVNGNVSSTPAGVTNTKTGEVRLGNAGGFKKGGASKKFADGGAVQDSGRAVKMPQGNKRPSTPVSISKLSGTFKRGGKVKMADGGDAQVAKNQMEYKQYEEDERKFNEGLRNDVKDAVMYVPRKAASLARKVGKAISDSDLAKGARNYGRSYKEGLGMKPDTPYEKDGGAIKKRYGGKC
jgi:hypothetical protein